MSKADDDDDDDDNIVGSPRSNHFAHHTHDRNDESRKKRETEHLVKAHWLTSWMGGESSSPLQYYWSDCPLCSSSP